MHDYTKADLDPQTKGMLDYSAKLTREPGAMREANVIKLRDLGLSDEQILSTALIAAMYAFMTRLADGLGVDVQQGPNRVHRALADRPRQGAGVADEGPRLGPQP